MDYDFAIPSINPQNFSGQRLRGRSFRGQDLTEANFSRCDLRGADFTHTNLTRANFTGAKTGITALQKVSLMGLTGLGAIAIGLGLYLVSQLLRLLLEPETQAATYQIPLAALIGLGIFLLLSLLRLPLKTWNKLFMGLVVLLVVLISMILGGYPLWGRSIALVALMLTLMAAGIQGIAILTAIAELLYGSLASCALVTIVSLWVWIAAVHTHTPTWMGLITVSLGITLGWRSLLAPPESATVQLEPPFPLQILAPELYRSIRDRAIAFTALGGTRFRHANLTQTNFYQARLKQSDFRGAHLHHTCFTSARDLCQARLEGSILQQPAVRQLLVRGNEPGQPFVQTNLGEANLQGAYLIGVDLRAANLQDADLSHACLQQANLEEANLTRVNAIGTDFTQACLTGATLVDWNIDASTQLQEINCRFCYPTHSSSADRSPTDRLPPQGEWQPGEFSQYFTVQDRDSGSLFEELATAPPPIAAALPTPHPKVSTSPDHLPSAFIQEILASLMVLVRLAMADHRLEPSEIQLLTESLTALELPQDITVKRLLDDRTPLDTLLAKINSPIIREKVYQSAYLMARIDGELANQESELLDRIQTHLMISPSKAEKLQTLIDQNLLEGADIPIAEQLQAIIDPNQRDAAVDNNIRFMCLMHAFSGAMPIPGFAIVTHLMIYKDQIELVQKIARIWGYPQDYHSTALDQVLFGSMGATAARVAISNLVLLIPGWGSVIGASSAFSMTWAIGELTRQFFASGGSLEADALTQQFTIAKQRGVQAFEASKDLIQQKQQAIATALEDLQQQFLDQKLSQQDFIRQLRELLT
ncbi:MAG: pentapeptide repeat-containing protein [Synechococcales bacterium]|nr:pentapeptide repeat-containing protein [Synechococcales bacterium]